jgi:alpha-galactosidase
MKKQFLLVMTVILMFQGCSTTDSPSQHPNKETPPMGWNSWNSFGFDVTEEIVKQIADYMAENMLEYRMGIPGN